MNTQRPFIHRLILITILIGVSNLMSGCIAELGLEAGLAEEMVGADLIGAEAVVGVEDASFLRGFSAESSIGEMTVADAGSMNGILGRVRMVKAYGEVPKLYFKGASSPFAEVYPEEGIFRMLKSNDTYLIPENIFSVAENGVRIRTTASTSGNILTTVKHGDLLVKLSEKNGWYQIRCVQNSRAYCGWIKGAYALPILLSTGKRKVNLSPEKEEKPQIKKTCIECNSIGTIKINRSCGACGGSGIVTCEQCSGTGKWGNIYPTRGIYEIPTCSKCRGTGRSICNNCSGKGQVTITQTCSRCNGAGYYFSEK